ncbi:MAG: DMT family transporter [bacterium]|nr:DMT family transporter [bacterium]
MSTWRATRPGIARRIAGTDCSSGTSRQSSGVWLLLASALGLSAASVLVKYISDRGDVLSVTAWQFILGGLVLLASAIAPEDLSATVWTPRFLLGLSYLSLIGTALTFLLWFVLIREDEVSRISTFNFLVPVFGLALGALLYQETVGWVVGAGILVTLAGLAIVSLPDRLVSPRPPAVQVVEG